ncbi:GNAT family N-acetyltransferase [Pontimicrobium sp. SW4]|uniref:GNAT family N-acetyltransferase n=1 Tax=Pontimicrobium sp. SW4 TaxID=3153519 RepID=A0AAU7BPX7_9FLAO
MKKFVFRLLAYFVCAFIMMIGFSFMTSLPEGLESLYSSWLTSNYLGLLIISFPLSYIINDLIGLLKGFFSKNEKGLSFSFFSFKSRLYYVFSHHKKKIKKLGVNNMIIREIKPEDNQSIEAIMTNCFKEFDMPTVGSSLEDDDVKHMYEGFQSDRAIYFVVEENGKVLGGGGIKQLKGSAQDTCELQKMYFHPDARGKGFGKKLFDACMKAAKDFDYKFCYLESAPQLKLALKLYEKNGFKYLEKPIGNTGHTICGVYMIKNIL